MQEGRNETPKTGGGKAEREARAPAEELERRSHFFQLIVTNMLEDRKVKLSCSQEQEHQPRGKHCRIGVVLSRFLMISSIAMVCVYGITTLRNEIKLDEATSASNLEHEQNLINEELPKSGTVSSDVYQDETDSKPITTENDHSKPRFVFHVGPQKMGTTTLQHDLGNLEWDNFLEVVIARSYDFMFVLSCTSIFRC